MFSFLHITPETVKMITHRAALFIFFYLVFILLPEYSLRVAQSQRAYLQMLLKSQNTDTSLTLKTLAGMIC